MTQECKPLITNEIQQPIEPKIEAYADQPIPYNSLSYQQPTVYQQQPIYQQTPIYQQQPLYQQTPVYQQPLSIQNDEETMSMLFFILGFFTCFTWIFGMAWYSKSSSEKARTYANLSKICFIIFTIMDIILFGIIFIVSLMSFLITFSVV